MKADVLNIGFFVLNKLLIKLSDLETGAYIVKVSIGDQTKAIRVIKE